jgi:hypothetical protein
MCFVGFQEHRVITCLYINYRLVCINQKKYVFAVRTGSANINKVKHRITHRVNMWKGKTKAFVQVQQYPAVSPFSLVHLVVANRPFTYKCMQRSICRPFVATHLSTS